jgi:NAD+ kinase
VYYNHIVRIAICRNLEKTEALTVAGQLQSILAEAGIACYFVEGTLMPDTDMLCVVGGDGTLFTYAHLALDADLPIWFINAGSVGFLAESSSALSARVAKVATGAYSLATRDTLVAQWGGKRYTALNDICLMRDTQHLQTVTMTVSTDAEQVAHYRGDGALVCTPMGATGYALSAGAPLMSPSSRGMLYMPICAHSLLAKPIVFGKDEGVTLHCLEQAGFFVDGVLCGNVEDASITVRLGRKKVRFVVTEPQTFFAKIGNKLL